MFFNRQVLVKGVEGKKEEPSGTVMSLTKPTQSQRVTGGGAGAAEVAPGAGVAVTTIGGAVGSMGVSVAKGVL